ncbi:hypothetical protein QAD02_010082 [Eretmocerus hayati]|uniref:Uncharacterized protein n=2 Tax=Eretmocerus hayati TaxID=131215 RepID=A0ACC2NDJ9_9HYME|nr:hypothetical protein QAD02_009633 [Eretmocerus hayati]KAJ8668419.1 hypothetical protein QAD02_010082 [Eretmocerus hayati]
MIHKTHYGLGRYVGDHTEQLIVKDNPSKGTRRVMDLFYSKSEINIRYLDLERARVEEGTDIKMFSPEKVNAILGSMEHVIKKKFPKAGSDRRAAWVRRTTGYFAPYRRDIKKKLNNSS